MVIYYIIKQCKACFIYIKNSQFFKISIIICGSLFIISIMIKLDKSCEINTWKYNELSSWVSEFPELRKDVGECLERDKRITTECFNNIRSKVKSGYLQKDVK